MSLMITRENEELHRHNQHWSDALYMLAQDLYSEPRNLQNILKQIKQDHKLANTIRLQQQLLKEEAT